MASAAGGTTTGEQNLAARLTHPDKAERDAGFALMERWVAALGGGAAAAGAEEMLKLWKALFYCVWMSDKPLVQQELIVRMAGLVRCLAGACAPPQQPRVAAFVGAFFATMRREWLGLDRNRVDKFMSLLRRMVYEALRYAGAAGTPAPAAAAALAVLQEALCTPPGGVAMHCASVYASELAATGCASGPRATTQRVLRLLAPLLGALAALGKDRALLANLHSEALRDGLLEALTSAAAAASASSSSSSSAPAAAAAAAAEARPMRGLPQEQRVDPHAAELALLLADRSARERAAQGAYASLSCAALAREFFAIGAAEGTAPAAREVAYDMHKRCAALAVARGEITAAEEALPALPAFEASSGGGGGAADSSSSSGGGAGGKKAGGPSKSKGGVKPWERKALGREAERADKRRRRGEEEGEGEGGEGEGEGEGGEEDGEEEGEGEEGEGEEEEEELVRPTPGKGKAGAKRRIAPPARANPAGFKKQSLMGARAGKRAAAAAEPAEGRSVRFSASAVKRKEGKRSSLGSGGARSGSGGGGSGGGGKKKKAGRAAPGGNPRRWGGGAKAK